MSPSAASVYVAMMTLTFSMDLTKPRYASSGFIISSVMQRSSLLSMSTGRMRSPMAWRSTVSVCTHTPSTQSTTTSAPSVTRSAAVTSDEKSTWPGESIRLMRKERSDTLTPDCAAAAESGGRRGGGGRGERWVRMRALARIQWGRKEESEAAARARACARGENTHVVGNLGGLVGDGRRRVALDGDLHGHAARGDDARLLLGGVLGVVLALGDQVVLKVHGHARRLDRDAALGLVGAVVGEARRARLLRRNNAGLEREKKNKKK
jgi:hypothetical protein